MRIVHYRKRNRIVNFCYLPLCITMQPRKLSMINSSPLNCSASKCTEIESFSTRINLSATFSSPSKYALRSASTSSRLFNKNTLSRATVTYPSWHSDVFAPSNIASALLQSIVVPRRLMYRYGISRISSSIDAMPKRSTT